MIVAAGGGLPGPGYTLIADEAVAADVWRSVTAQEGVEPLGADGWEMARVLAGRPRVGAELTEEYNPLEAGLCHAVSVTKGCSIGQETIAKVRRGRRQRGAVCCGVELRRGRRRARPCPRAACRSHSATPPTPHPARRRCTTSTR